MISNDFLGNVELIQFFWYYGMNSMKYMRHSPNKINDSFDKGSEILPSYNQEKIYDLIELEVYKIIIE